LATLELLSRPLLRPPWVLFIAALEPSLGPRISYSVLSPFSLPFLGSLGFFWGPSPGPPLGPNPGHHWGSFWGFFLCFLCVPFRSLPAPPWRLFPGSQRPFLGAPLFDLVYHTLFLLSLYLAPLDSPRLSGAPSRVILGPPFRAFSRNTCRPRLGSLSWDTLVPLPGPPDALLGPHSLIPSSFF
jgi:hypothetical protein